MSQSDAGVSLWKNTVANSNYLPDPYSWANSVLVHLFVVTALLIPFWIRGAKRNPPFPQKLFNLTPIVLTFPHLPEKAGSDHGGGGSGDKAPLPASKGVLPTFARTQFAPARVITPKVDLALAMPATLLGPPELKLPKPDAPFGDPLSQARIPSQGPGSGGSIGSGNGTGIGPGQGPGYGPGRDGGCCEGVFAVGSGVSAPVAIYSPEPAYSEEARRAKLAGIVKLWIVVDAQGLVRDVKVVKSLGMGLDEEAAKTVATWRFKPSMRNGVPVPVRAAVEVSFRLF